MCILTRKMMMLLMMLMTPMTNHLVASTCNQHRHPDSEKCAWHQIPAILKILG